MGELVSLEQRRFEKGREAVLRDLWNSGLLQMKMTDDQIASVNERLANGASITEIIAGA